MGKVNLCICLLLVVAVAAEVDDQFYPRYHLAAPNGTLGEPSGFCEYNKEYHIFYQYNPSTSSSGEISWGHAKSSDFFTWEQLPVILKPGNGVSGLLSGSAYVEDDKIYLYYTTNQEVTGIFRTKSKTQKQALAISTNGLNATKFVNNSIIEGSEFQPNFRNPNVFKNGDTYYMVVGNSFEGRGRVLLFTSKDKVTWGNATVLFESDGTLGSVWENPDFFEIDRKFVLIISAQGIEADRDDYKNKYQTGYIIGTFDYSTKVFAPLTLFRELDHGHDFYAAKTTTDRRGRRRYLTAWLDMEGQKYPEVEDGFRGILSLPRELSISRDDVLLQSPVKEADKLDSETLYRGKNKEKEVIRLPDKAADVTIEADSHKKLNIIVESDNKSDKVTITYDNRYGTVTLNRGGRDKERTTLWKPSGDKYTWRLFIDASSLELFCGDGEVTFSSRFFPKGEVLVRVDKKVKKLTVKAIKRTIKAIDGQ